MINWTVEKILLMKDETGLNWTTLDNILNVSGLSVIINRAKNMPTLYKFPSKRRKAKVNNQNLNDTLVPMITSLGEYARDNGNKLFYKKMQGLLSELQSS